MSTKSRGIRLKFKADLLTWSSFLLFIIALPLPFEKDTHEVTYTFLKVLTGWYFSLTFQTFVWLAFPLLGTAWACHVESSPKADFVLSSSGLLLALPFMYGPVLSYGWIDSMKTLQQTPQAGYYLLLLCLLLQIFASMYARLVEL
jgi:cellobiose-specific phosphotransferase system component IIC